MKPALHIEKILRQELDLYGSVCALEEEKGGAIIARDGKLLEALSVKQEKLLNRINALEEQRGEAVDEFRKEHRSGAEASLREIAASLDGEGAARLTRTGAVLKSLLWKIQALTETNGKLAKDSIDFYNVLLAEAKSKVSLKTGYTRKAVENSTIENPLIFNRMV